MPRLASSSISLVVALGIALVVALSSPAAGAPRAGTRPRVAVLELTVEGDASPELRTQVERSLATGFTAAGWQVVRRDEVAAALRNHAELDGCLSTQCLERIGALVSARRFVRARVQAAGAAYDVALELLGPTGSADLAGRVERSCAPCTIVEVNEAVAAAARELAAGRNTRADAAASDPVRVTVRSEPEAASIIVDGRFVGAAPVELLLPPGEHVFRARLPRGYDPVERRELVGPQAHGAPQEIVLVLPADVPRAEPRGRRFGAWKWITAGTAVASLAAGAALITLDGRETGCAPMTECRYRTSSLAGGIVLGGVGLTAAGASTYMFFRERDSPPRSRRDTRRPAVGVAPLAGGAAVVVGGAF